MISPHRSSEAREQLAATPYAIIFTRANTFTSRVTRFFTREVWSHTGILINGKVFHSTLGTGCHVSSLKEFLDGTEFFFFSFNPNFNPGSPISIEEERAIECLDVEYDNSLLPEIATGTRDEEDFTNQAEAIKEMVCSEYSEYILFGTGHSLTPGELLAIVEKSSN